MRSSCTFSGASRHGTILGALLARTQWQDGRERSGVLPSVKDRASTVFRNRRSTALRSIDSAGSGSAPDELSRHTTASRPCTLML